MWSRNRVSPHRKLIRFHDVRDVVDAPVRPERVLTQPRPGDIGDEPHRSTRCQSQAREEVGIALSRLRRRPDPAEVGTGDGADDLRPARLDVRDHRAASSAHPELARTREALSAGLGFSYFMSCVRHPAVR